ncbi:MAG: DUF4153 domain-containing protein, partial [Bacillota bacterium]|nr:DUF4153 domain-containing protein [Bacillota bacterium]
EKWIILNSRKLIPALVVPVLLLFTSIFIRIYHYGFTESRYFLLLFALFNTLGLLLLFVYKWRAQFAIVVLSIVMLHISMYGSLSARNVTYHSQMNILAEIFKEQGHDLEQILGGGATCAGVILESEVAYRIDSCIDKIMAQKISDFEGREYAALKDLQSSCAMLSTKYYSNSVREKSVYTNLSAYNYDGIVHLADHEYMFRIRDMEEIEVGDFVVSGNPSGIAIFDKNDYNRRSETGNVDEQSHPGLCYFDFLTNVIEDNAEVPVYQMHFAFDNREFEVFFILEDFNFNVDEEKNIVEDSYNYYTIYCVLRERR